MKKKSREPRPRPRPARRWGELHELAAAVGESTGELRRDVELIAAGLERHRERLDALEARAEVITRGLERHRERLDELVSRMIDRERAGR